MDRRNLGAKTLKPRLSVVLKDQIQRQLPSLLEDIELEISTSKAQLKRLGSQRTSVNEQRRYLLQVSREFTQLMQAAADGVYNDSFFGSAKTEEGYKKRLRARVQNTLAAFSETMRLQGRTQIIVDTTSPDVLPSGHISRSEFLEEAKEQIKRSRGRELAGTFNPLVIGELFTAQCQPWPHIVSNVNVEMLRAVYEVSSTIVNHIAVEETAAGLFAMISRSIEPLKRDIEKKLAELLKPHSEGHPVTYNNSLTETVQKVQAERSRKLLEKQLREVFGTKNFVGGHPISVYPFNILSQLEKHIEVDMERHGSEVAVDYMEAYYQVST